MKSIKFIISFLVIFILLGCVGSEPQAKLSSEEMKAQAEFKSQLLAQLRQGMQARSFQPTIQGTEPQNSVQVKSYITDEELLEKFNQFPQVTSGIKFTKLKDGFKINNTSRYLDTEGEIINFGYNWQNGNVTYLIKTSHERYKIKFVRAGTGEEAIEIADVYRDAKQYKITTVTGKKITSDGLILTSKGFIALRDESAFIYTIGEKLYNFSAPEGWHIARFQNGDVASTKYILLERTTEKSNSKSGNDLLNFIEATKELASLVGITDKQDYMLVNVYDSTKSFLFDITLGEKNVGYYSDCKKTSRYIAKCDTVEFSEALYKQNGLPNTGHYYWTILWYSTPDGAIAATRENTQTKVMVTDLISGKKVEAAFRVTGFPELSGEQDKNGKIKLTVGGGYLSDVVIDDANKLLTEMKDISLIKVSN